MKNCLLKNAKFIEASFNEVITTNVIFDNNDFTSSQFYGNDFKNIDFSTSIISNITTDLKSIKKILINTNQAIDLVTLLDVKVIE